MVYLKRIIVIESGSKELEKDEDYWLCEECIDSNQVNGDVIDQGEELRECSICGAES